MFGIAHYATVADRRNLALTARVCRWPAQTYLFQDVTLNLTPIYDHVASFRRKLLVEPRVQYLTHSLTFRGAATTYHAWSLRQTLGITNLLYRVDDLAFANINWHASVRQITGTAQHLMLNNLKFVNCER